MEKIFKEFVVGPVRHTAEIKELTDIEELKPYTIHLLKTNSNQAAFIASALEIICQQQEQIFKLRKKTNKKATLMSRIKFDLFGKKSGN